MPFLMPTRTARPRRAACLAADLLVAGQKDGILHFLTIKDGSLLPAAPPHEQDERLDGLDAWPSSRHEQPTNADGSPLQSMMRHTAPYSGACASSVRIFHAIPFVGL